MSRFSSVKVEKNALDESFTAIPVGTTSPQASFEQFKQCSAKSGYRSIFPVAVRGKRPEFFT